jgi:N-acetylmuramoyl-L-alanine amidase
MFFLHNILKKEMKIMADKKVFIDKGHGANDPGCVGNGLRECDLVDKIADYAVEELDTYDGVVTKIGPRPAGSTSAERLNPRTAAANSWGADLCVSFHINAAGGTGWESFIYTNTSPADDEITKVIHQMIADWFGSQGIRDRGQKRESLALVRQTNMTSTLLEFGFIDNDNDVALLKQESKLKEMGVVAAQAIATSLGLSKKIDTPVSPPVDTKVGGNCSVVVNGKWMPVIGIMYDSSSYVPIRAVGNSVGAEVGWDNEAGQATLNGINLVTTYTYNTIGYAHSVEVAKILGYQVEWNGDIPAVLLTK